MLQSMGSQRVGTTEGLNNNYVIGSDGGRQQCWRFSVVFL